MSRPTVVTALGSIATTLSLWAIFAEARLQVPPHWATATLLVAIGSGAALGLWLPRRFIVRQLVSSGMDRPPSSVTHTTNFDTSIASGICGGLLALLALVALADRFMLPVAENLRSGMVDGFVMPIGAIWCVVAALIASLAALVTIIAVTIVVALHGWLRLLAAPQTPIARLWRAQLVGALAAFALIAASASRYADLLAACVAFIAAGWSVAARAMPIASNPAIAASQSLRSPRLAARRRMTLLGFATALIGASLASAAPPRGDTSLVALTALGCASLLVAMLTRRGMLDLPRRATFAAITILLAIAIIGPFLAPAAGLVGAAIAAVWIAVSLGRHLILLTGSVQAALARIGAAASIGLCIGASLAGMVRQFALPKSSLGRSAALADERSPLHEIVPTLCSIDALDMLNPANPVTLWNLERTMLSGDLLITNITQFDSDHRERLLRRLANAIPHGGRLIIELAQDDRIAQTARKTWRVRRDDAAWLLDFQTADNSTFRALILGRDAPAWLRHFSDDQRQLRLVPLDPRDTLSADLDR
ncbi:MAG: hypothetical protein ACKVS9_03710 [Phycisphaerae bacterium]